VEYEKLSDNRAGATSHGIRARVEAARRQRERFAGVEGVSCNAEMHPAEIRDHCELDAALFKAAMRQPNLLRSAYGVLKTGHDTQMLVSSRT
jgi:magnesium chelatase family protein